MSDHPSRGDSEQASESADAPSFWSRNQSRLRLVAAGGGLVLLLLGALWFVLNEDGPSPHEMQREALERLQDRDSLQARNHARRLAKLLEAMEFRDAEFPGAIEYILGIATFRDAQEMGEVGREQRYRLAVQYLEEARLQAVDEPELAYALGLSLYQLGHYSTAREQLEVAVQTYPLGRVDASLRLQDIYLNSKEEPLLQQALTYNAQLLQDDSLDDVRRDEVYLQRAQLQMALGLNAEATHTLGNLTEESSRKQSTQVFHAQVLMTKADKVLDGRLPIAADRPASEDLRASLESAKHDYERAIALLKPSAEAFGMERPQARRAAFLIAVCHERIGDIHTALFDDSTRKNYDLAIASYERTAEKYETSHEGVAANLRAADLLRRESRHEEALKAYKRALQTVRRSEDFSNRWLTLKDFQAMIRAAWKDMIDHQLYETAIELSKRMVPLFPGVEARRFTAEAQQHWAEHLQTEFHHAGFAQRSVLERELRERWRMSGRAYADLAHELRTSSDYPDALWTSAQHYRNGHDFEQALNQLVAFIATRPTERLPLAQVRLGEVLLDLDHPVEALKQFEQVVTEYPTELAAFEALYLVGVAQLELNQLDQAEQTWRKILNFGELTPASIEWRKSLYSLGDLLYHRAAAFSSRSKVESAESTSETLDAEFRMWHAAARSLEEYLKRYPQHADALDVRYLLAKSLQRSAEVPYRKLKIAETENARQELTRSLNALLDQAKSELLALQQQLLELDASDRLDEVGECMLRECFFEIAHTYFALGMFEEAIVRYGAAANRYPADPQVLLAYLQMSNCNDRLGKSDEARSMLEQARIIHKSMHDAEFEPHLTNMNKPGWSGWIEWARQLHRAEADEQLAEAQPGT